MLQSEGRDGKSTGREASPELAVKSTKEICNGRRGVGDYPPLRRSRKAVVGGSRRLVPRRQRQACSDMILHLGTGVERDTSGRRSRVVCPPVERTDENKKHGPQAVILAHPRPPTQRQRQEHFTEVHWDTQICCELRKVISRRLRASNRNTSSGRTCVWKWTKQSTWKVLGRTLEWRPPD